jgi:hypothetical protein
MAEPELGPSRRGGLADLVRRIPGFRGYMQREERRESDRLQRSLLADELARCRRRLDAWARRAVEQARLDDLPAIERLRTRLLRLEDRIRGAVEGYSGLFAQAQIDERVLALVYEHDCLLDEWAERLGQSIAEPPASSSPQGPPTQLDAQAVEQQLDAFERAWARRERILRGTEQDILAGLI